jgi:hypothetical protein
LQHGGIAHPHEGMHRRDPFVEAGDQLGLASIEEAHLDRLGVSSARDKDLPPARRAETLQGLDDDCFVCRREIGRRVERVGRGLGHAHGGERGTTVVLELCRRLVPQHRAKLLAGPADADGDAGSTGDEGEPHIGARLTDRACRGNAGELVVAAESWCWDRRQD